MCGIIEEYLSTSYTTCSIYVHIFSSTTSTPWNVKSCVISRKAERHTKNGALGTRVFTFVLNTASWSLFSIYS
jgi:hypothetical protein